MSDALNKNVPVYPAIYCEDEQGNPDSTTAMYPWCHIRAAGPNVLKDTTFCGENKFSGDVQVDGDLTVDGEITGNITVDPPFQGDIPCKEIDANQEVDRFTGTDQNNWNPTSSGYNGQTSIIICRVSTTTNLTGFVNQGQCYVVLISPTDNNGQMHQVTTITSS